MISIKIQNGAEGAIRRLVPSGVECYVVGRIGDRYLKVRTHDAGLISILKAAAL